MDYFTTIMTRRSIRKYKKRPVKEEDLEKILEAGRLAPSANNQQEWFFVAVKKKELKEQLARDCYEQTFIGDASAVIVVCLDKRIAKDHGPIDVAIATTQMWLAAVALGLSSCWIGAINPEAVSTTLELENYLKPMAVLPIGYADEDPEPTSRKSLEEISQII